jgi:hypothetical protein
MTVRELVWIAAAFIIAELSRRVWAGVIRRRQQRDRLWFRRRQLRTIDHPTTWHDDEAA